MLVYKGDRVTCTNGHVIGDVLENMNWGDKPNAWSDAFAWRQADMPPKPGSMVKPKCATCGAPFISEMGWAFHISGWRPPVTE